MYLRLELDEHPTAAHSQQLVDNVRIFNLARSGNDAPRPVAYFLRDEQGEMVGGVQGSLWGRSMHLDALWVHEHYRGQGWGAKLMQAIENYAAAHGHPLIYLETTSFQARPFYESLGYRVFGELPDISPGHTLFFLQKEKDSN